MATYDAIDLPLGVDSLTAVYSGDSTYATSTSSPVSETVTQSPTTMTTAISPNPTYLNGKVSIKAKVLAPYPTQDYPTGTYTFFDGSTVLGTMNVVLSEVTDIFTSLGVGTHDLTVQYSGNAEYVPVHPPSL